MIRVRQISIPIENANEITIKNAIAHKLKIKREDILSYQIYKESIDARKKPTIFFVYEVNVLLQDENSILKKKLKDVFLAEDENYTFEATGKERLRHPIIVVGSGPAGLFTTYMLAKYHYPVLLIERGEKIEDRVQTVETFFETGVLNPNSNVQFGEGGAGTFSDGKLNTLVKDSHHRIRFVFETFVKFGAPKEILYQNKPHIGTDILRNVIINMRHEILKLGAQIRYDAKLTNIFTKENKLIGIEVNETEKIDTNTLVLAIGHSARDTFELLKAKNITMNPKPFAVGLRIMHPTKMINKSQYGREETILGNASYKLTYRSKSGRGVYSFCMCPGGFVVNASSEEGRLAVNGMSNYHRDEEFSNSAILVTITPDDFGTSVLDGVNYQRELEEKAYALGNGCIPIQTYGDFLANKKSSSLGEVKPIFKGKTTLSNLNPLFSLDITNSLKEGITYFGTKIKGFDREDAILAGVESRSSSPVRIERDEVLESNVKGIYPCGEGAGYAGGITSASVDGIRVFEAIASKYEGIKD